MSTYAACPYNVAPSNVGELGIVGDTYRVANNGIVSTMSGDTRRYQLGAEFKPARYSGNGKGIVVHAVSEKPHRNNPSPTGACSNSISTDSPSHAPVHGSGINANGAVDGTLDVVGQPWPNGVTVAGCTDS